MKKTVLPALKNLDKSIIHLEKLIVKHEKQLAIESGEPELFAFANENDRKFKKALASKLDSTIERLETLLAEE